ncbi:MAG: UDP-N-acetylmuramoyl-L-alanyl-D-glutamate--2,6-diaminopimelate ligase [Planctomycetaceae bacterium]
MNVTALNLQRLLPGVDFCAHSATGTGTPSVDPVDLFVNGVTADSRQVRPGDVFVAVRGTQSDGHAHIGDAVANGAVAVVVQQAQSNIPVPQYVVPCSATAFAKMTMTVHVGHRCPIVNVGITGTNGKTTTSWMLRSMMQAAGLRTGLIGTIESSDGVSSSVSTMTTPSADALAVHLKTLMQQQATHNVMEISSHALVQKRCEGIRLSAAAITNITQDHFDYHGTADAYRAAKAQIAGLLHPDAPLLLNMDDPGCQFLLDRMVGSAAIISYGIQHPDAELRASLLHRTHRSQRLRLHLAQGDAEVRLRLIGQHNVSNSLVAAGLAEQLGIRIRDIVEGLESLHNVPGRLERIDEGQAFQVLVDYAHTTDALERCLATIREYVPGRLICVFGAGGNRDQSKRPMMAEAAAAADLCIVTSDNPRNEDPQQIIAQITAGFPRGTQFTTRTDRREAIALAFELAEAGDVVLLAGKGHESIQEIGRQQLPFDDRVVARELLRPLSGSRTLHELSTACALNRSA